MPRRGEDETWESQLGPGSCFGILMDVAVMKGHEVVVEHDRLQWTTIPPSWGMLMEYHGTQGSFKDLKGHCSFQEQGCTLHAAQTLPFDPKASFLAYSTAGREVGVDCVTLSLE